MEIAIFVLLVIGALAMVIGGLWLLAVAFRESLLWGLGSLFVPFVQLVYVVRHWEDARVPFLTNLAGCALAIAAGVGAFKTPSTNGQGTVGQNFATSFLRGFVDGYHQSRERAGGSGGGIDKAEPSIAAAPKPTFNSSLPAERLAFLQQEVPRRTVELEARYQTLATQRASLPPGDAVALSAFNAAAAHYAASLQEMRAMKAELEGVPMAQQAPMTDLETRLGYRDSSLREIESERALVVLQFQAATKPLLAGKSFAQLDKIASGLRTTKAACSDGSLHLSAFYDALAQLDERASDESWKARIDLLTEWTKKNPKSITARVALGTACVGWAVKGRGGRYVNATTPSGALRFKERLDKGVQILEGARSLSEKCPVAWELQLTIAGVLKTWDRNSFDRIYQSARQSDPGYFGYAMVKAVCLAPQLRGQPGEMQKFVTEASDAVGGEAGDIFYARLAWGLETSTLFPSLVETRLDWPRVRRGLQLILKDQANSVGAASKLCTLSLYNNDVESAKQLFPRIGPVVDLSVFKSRQRFIKEREETFR